MKLEARIIVPEEIVKQEKTQQILLEREGILTQEQLQKLEIETKIRELTKKENIQKT
jgi:hypothetical protein